MSWGKRCDKHHFGSVPQQTDLESIWNSVAVTFRAYFLCSIAVWVITMHTGWSDFITSASWVIWDKDKNNNPLIHLDCRGVRSRFLQTMFVKWTRKVLTSSNVLFWYITISEVLHRNVQSEHMACGTTEPSPCIQCGNGLRCEENLHSYFWI